MTHSRGSMPHDSDDDEVDAEGGVEQKRGGGEGKRGDDDDGGYGGDDSEGGGGRDRGKQPAEDESGQSKVKVNASRDINASRATPEVDMRECKLPDRVKEVVVDLAQQALEQSSVPTAMAKFIKMQLDKDFHPSWHVVVGRDFGMCVSHAEASVAYFYVGELAFLVYKHSAE